MPGLNWLAVAVAAIAVFVVSTVYYIVFTGQLKRVSAAYANADGRPEPWKVAVEIVRSFVVGTVVAGLISLIGITDLGGAIQLGLALWIGFPVVLLTGSVIWEKVPPMLARHPQRRLAAEAAHHHRHRYALDLMEPAALASTPPMGWIRR